MTLFSAIWSILAFTSLTASSPLTTSNHHQPTPHTNLTNSKQLSIPQCLFSDEWVTPHFLAGDCYTCIDKLHNREIEKWHTVPLDFVSYHTPQSSIWTQGTPRRYKYKSCTIAIVMLKDMPPDIITPLGFPARDEVSYSELELTAREIIARCLSVVTGNKGGRGVNFVNPTGYEITGRNRAIGVFIWDTFSHMNQQIPLDLANALLTDLTNTTRVSKGGRYVEKALRGRPFYYILSEDSILARDEMLLLFQIIVVFSASNAIALEHNQHSVLYSSDMPASCLIVAERIVQPKSASPEIYRNLWPTNECGCKRKTSAVVLQSVYKRADDILVEKPPGPIAGNGVEGQGGGWDQGFMESTPRPITTESTNHPTVSATSLKVTASDVFPAPVFFSALPSTTTRTAATFFADQITSPTARSIGSATLARASINTPANPDTSRNIAEQSAVPKSTIPTTSLNGANVPTRSREFGTITTNAKQTIKPTNISKRSSLPVITSSPSLPTKIVPSTVTTSSNPPSPPTVVKTPIIIGVAVGIGVAVALTILGIILIILKRRRRRSNSTTLRERASLPRYVDGKRELDAGIEQLAPQEIDGVEVGGPQELFTRHNVPEIGIERHAPQELMTCDNVHEIG